MIKENTKCLLEKVHFDSEYLIKNNKPYCVWFQTLFETEKGIISLVHLGYNELFDLKWEILCIKGELFEDIERFDTMITAIEKIKYYLN